jgi:hypothetical protein
MAGRAKSFEGDMDSVSASIVQVLKRPDFFKFDCKAKEQVQRGQILHAREVFAALKRFQKNLSFSKRGMEDLLCRVADTTTEWTFKSDDEKTNWVETMAARLRLALRKISQATTKNPKCLWVRALQLSTDDAGAPQASPAAASAGDAGSSGAAGSAGHAGSASPATGTTTTPTASTTPTTYMVGYSHDTKQAWRCQPGTTKEFTTTIAIISDDMEDPVRATWADGYSAELVTLTGAEYTEIQKALRLSGREDVHSVEYKGGFLKVFQLKDRHPLLSLRFTKKGCKDEQLCQIRIDAFPGEGSLEILQTITTSLVDGSLVNTKDAIYNMRNKLIAEQGGQQSGLKQQVACKRPAAEAKQQSACKRPAVAASCKVPADLEVGSSEESEATAMPSHSLGPIILASQDLPTAF